MRFSNKARLFVGTAGTVCAIAMASSPAAAQCTTSGSTVTCTGTTTVIPANVAINSATPPSVTINVQTGATITRDATNVLQPSGTTFNGAVVLTNAGTLGTPAETVNFRYFGTPDAATNSFSLTNSGVVTGFVRATGVGGGGITASNSGTIAGGLTLRGSGPITLTSSDAIYVAGGGSGSRAIDLQSDYTGPTSTTGTGLNVQGTSTRAGGPVTATITGPVAIPAVPATATTALVPAVPQGVFLLGLGGAQLNLNALAGTVTVRSDGASTEVATPAGGNVETAGDTTTTRSANSVTNAGGAASAVIGADAQINSLTVVSGPAAASASVAGRVGTSTAPGSVSVQSTAVDLTSTYTTIVSGTTAATVTTTSTDSSTPAGGAASFDLASTGQVYGSVSVYSNKGAGTATVAGTIGAGSGTTPSVTGDLSVVSQGVRYTDQSNNSRTTSGATTGDFANVSSFTQAASGTTAAATIASTGNIFGSANVGGDGGALVDNAGRIRNGVTVTSSSGLTTAEEDRNSRTTTVGSGGTNTVVTANSSNSTETAIGGAGSFTNRSTGVVEDNVDVFSVGAASLTNAGALFGNVSLTSSGTNFTSTNSDTTTTTAPTTAGAAVATTTRTIANTSTGTPAGGTATGDYGGTIGSLTAVSSGSIYRTVNQYGQAGSSATIGGTLFADVSIQSGGSAYTSNSGSASTTTTQAFTAPATPARETVSSSQSRDSSTWVAANSTVTLTGAVRNNGTGTGDLFVSASAGVASATVNGGTVDGSLTVSGGGGVNSTSGRDTSNRSTVAATTTGPVANTVAQSATNADFSTSQGVSGSAALTLTKATVGGSVSVLGRGTGAGGGGASLAMSSDSIVTGSVNIGSNFGGGDSRTENNTVDTRTAANAINRTVTRTTTQTVPVNYGNATAALAGTTGSANIYASFGAASATLTGQVLGGISVNTGGTITNSSSQTTYSGTSATNFAFPATPTGFTSTNSTIWSGGAASLAISTPAMLQATNTAATTGAVNVNGFGGSTLTIAAGSRVATGNSGVLVGGFFTNTSQQQTNTYAAGAQTGQTTTNTSTAVGGPASLTNAGTIGSSAGYFGAPLTVSVQSVGGANVTNSGTVYGQIIANSLAVGSQSNRTLNTTTTSTSTGLNDAVLSRTVTTTTNTGAGGATSVANTGVVSGLVFVGGSTGTLTNSGVLRNGVSLGQAIGQFTQTDTQTATTRTTVATAPTTRFAQTYTVNQNGLLFGGVNVTGATITDPSTGAAANATLRTSDVTATVNLNSGSITNGNITAQRVSATDNTRLTNTTVLLNDAGFLGVGTFDASYISGVGVGAGTLRYVNTPNYIPYVAIDPALGTVTGTTFSPNTFVGNGTQVLGVTLVEKTGTGIFTIAGTSYVAPTAANASATYTMDVGTFRNTAGEIQLGVAGSDPVTGASVFGIRGNVENNAVLTLGRRVTDGSNTVLQGVAVRVDGNYTQGSTGTLAVAATPALVRANGTQTLPSAATGQLGFANYGIALTPFVAYDPTSTTSLRSTPSTLLVNGNATLAGTVAVTTSPGSIYTAGRVADVITVTGTYSATGLTLNSGFSSPFLTFTLSPRTVGSTTVVSLDVTRNAYSSVTANTNAAAAAAALQAAIPNVVSRISAIRNPLAVTDVQGYGRLQDLATVIAGLDTQLSAADAATAFNQLASGSFYGSLQAVATTAPFGEAVDQLPAESAPGAGLWFRPTGQFAKLDGDSGTGALKLKADNYGGSAGFAASTGNGGFFGIGGGYGRIKARPVGYLARATADTYMIGAFGGIRLAGVNVGAQAVFGWSNWDAFRALPIFSRTATASFDSKEFRFTARAAYDFDLGQALLSPFAKLDVRRYSFEDFEEANAGGIGLAVAKRTDTVLNPELGVRLGGSFAGIQPFAEASYVFQGNVKGYKTVSYLGDPTTTFRLDGVDPDGFVKLGAGVQADVYGATVYLRGNYLTSGGVSTGEAQGGLVIRF